MKFLVLTVLAYIATASAQLGSLGAVGSKIGSKVGSDIGLATGTLLDTVPNVIGIKPKPETIPSRPISPFRSPGPRDRGSSSSGGRSYERRNSGGEYAKGGDYVRERTVYETERSQGYEAGRGRQDSGRVRAGSRSDYY